MFKSIPTLLLMFALFSAPAAELTRIVLPRNPSKPEQYAAIELQQILKKMTGREFPVLREDNFAGKNAFILGTPASSPLVQQRCGELDLDEKNETDTVSIHPLNGNLFLTGRVPREVLFSVYFYLQHGLGVRWFYPGDDGEFIPSQTRIELPRQAVHSSAAFKYRALPVWKVPPEQLKRIETWLTRNFINCELRDKSVVENTGAYSTIGGHSVAIYDRKLFQKHSDWYAVIPASNGKRTPKGLMGCWSNPGFYDYMVKKHIDMIDKSKADICSLHPADVAYHCICADCQKIAKDPSTKWFTFYNRLAGDLKKQRPQVEFCSIAYQYYIKPPQVSVDASYVQFCQYGRCHFHPLSAPCNKSSMAAMNEWRKRSRLGIFAYHFGIFMKDRTYLYAPHWNVLQDEARTFRDLGIVRMRTGMASGKVRDRREVGNLEDRYRADYYVYAQLLWNPDLDIPKFLEEWCRKLYGPAAPVMHGYMTRMAARWGAMTVHQRGYWQYDAAWTAKEFLTPELITQTLDAFRQAKKLVSGGKEKERIKLAEELFNEWLQLYYRKNAAVALPKGKSYTAAVRLDVDKDTLLSAFCQDTTMFFKVECRNSQGPDKVVLSFTNVDGIFRFETDRPAGAGSSWNAEFTIPFAKLGMSKPPFYNIGFLMERTNGSKTSSFPDPASQTDPAVSCAALYFPKNSHPERRMVWFMPDGIKNNRNLDITRFSEALILDGWTYRECKIPNAEGISLDEADLIVLSYQKEAIAQYPKDFIRKKVLPAVRAGKTAVFNTSSYNTASIPSFVTGDASLKVKFEWTKKGVQEFVDGDFAKKPHDLNKLFASGTFGTITPLNPEKWTYLAMQGPVKNAMKPWLISTPYGKGTLVFHVGRFNETHWAKLLTNIFEYVRKKSCRSPDPDYGRAGSFSSGHVLSKPFRALPENDRSANSHRKSPGSGAGPAGERSFVSAQ